MAGIVATAHLVAKEGDREGLCGEPISDYSLGQVRTWRQCSGCHRIAMLLATRDLFCQKCGRRHA